MTISSTAMRYLAMAAKMALQASIFRADSSSAYAWVQGTA